MSHFLRAAAEVDVSLPTAHLVPNVRIAGGYQPVAYDGRREMLALIAEMRAIDRNDRRLTRRQWIGMARRFVRAKWAILGREMTMLPPRGGSGEMRRGGPRKPSGTWL